MYPIMQRRCSLEEWMTKLLSDIDISRSIIVASFLELESAARACMSLPDSPGITLKLEVARWSGREGQNGFRLKWV